jgi:hypothetical protein
VIQTGLPQISFLILIFLLRLFLNGTGETIKPGFFSELFQCEKFLIGDYRFPGGGHYLAINSLNRSLRASARLIAAGVGFLRTWAMTSRIIVLSFMTVGCTGLALILMIHLFFNISPITGLGKGSCLIRQSPALSHTGNCTETSRMFLQRGRPYYPASPDSKAQKMKNPGIKSQRTAKRKGLEGRAGPAGLRVPEGNGAKRNPGKPGPRAASAGMRPK